MAIDIKGAVVLQGSVDWTASSAPAGGKSGGVTINGQECLVDDGTEHTALAPPPLPPAHPTVSGHANAKVKLVNNPNVSGHTIGGKPIISLGSVWLQHVNNTPAQPIAGMASGTVIAVTPVMLHVDGLISVGFLNGVGFQV